MRRLCRKDVRRDVRERLWISAPGSKNDVPSKNVVIRNNYVSKMGAVSPGNIVTGNVIVTNPSATFKVFDKVNHIYDLNLK